MKIGIDIQSTQGKKTGLGVYTEHLVRELRQNFNHKHQYCLYEKDPQKELNTPGRLIWENIELPGLAKRDKVDVLHVPAFAAPVNKPAPLVVTVHDLIGKVFPNQSGWPSRFYWGQWLPNSFRNADRIIADSENTKKDIIKHLAMSEGKIRIIYPSGHESFSPHLLPEKIDEVKRKLGIREKYFLFVGTIEPRKNLTRVIEAFLQFKKNQKSGTNYQLAVVGSQAFAHGKVFRDMLHRFGAQQEDVLYSSYIAHEDLNALYQGAVALLFPSLYEGWGLPVLEAMACGTPVLTSNTSSLPEVAGDAALLVDPYDVDAICSGIKRLTDDTALWEQLVVRGLRRVKKFSWKQTAEQTLEVYQSLG